MKRIRRARKQVSALEDTLAQQSPLLNLWISVGKGAFVAAVLSLAYVLLLALCIKTMAWSEGIIVPANQVMKIVSVIIGAWIAVRRTPQRGWLRGGLTGIVYMVLGFVLFSLVQGDFAIMGGYWIDLATGAVVGAVSGMLLVNFKK